jgi:hypothetical protein
MMVDTINPNTDQPDGFPTQPAGGTQTPPQVSQSNDQADHFYGGFGKPDEVKVNLVGDPGSSNENPTQMASGGSAFDIGIPSESASEPQEIDTPSLPNMNTSSLSEAESTLHGTYSKKRPINARAVAAIAGIGVVATMIVAVVLFFVLGSSNASKLAKEQATLDELSQKVATLSEAPESLEPVVAEETPDSNPEEDIVTEETEGTTPTVIPETTEEIETTTTEVPEKDDSNSASAAG